MARTKKKVVEGTELKETEGSSSTSENIDEEEYLELDEELEEGKDTTGTGYVVKKKPTLPPSVKRALRLRKERKAKKGKFRRQEWFRYPRLGTKWRKPRGLHSKMRRRLKYRPKMPNVGYCAPKEARYLHSSGFKEVLVFNPKDLDDIDPNIEAARIGHTVGTRKRRSIEERAQELGIRVLNAGGL